ncbi:hypothetical protein [Nocardioides sp. CER19]|uniref:hypothetical protein n=1 Tax=Nocardioides sp. CER19 TaxID=3038538 RepID=UPI0024490792|nr:hypothetical protein [Nocardioides sp. CER19]MDH2413923.1 hypothetical protein [Nocardioides sp. CER19]
MAESAADFYARVVAQVGEGRLPAPPVTEWPTFPWEVEDGAIVAKRLAPPGPEESRRGTGGVDCGLCDERGAVGTIWRDDVWRVKPLPTRHGLPLTLMLETHEHLDFTDLDEHQAAQVGVLTVRLARIVESLPNIARCHVGRWGEGTEHCHVWFFGRTEGLLQTRGSFAIEWDEILPPGPEDLWRADLAEVARKLVTHGGEVLV